MYFLQRIACDIDFNDSEAYAGTAIYWIYVFFYRTRCGIYRNSKD